MSPDGSPFEWTPKKPPTSAEFTIPNPEETPAQPDLKQYVQEIDFDGENRTLPPYRFLDIKPEGIEKDIPVVSFSGFGGKSSDFSVFKTIPKHLSRRFVSWDEEFGVELGDLRYDQERSVPTEHLSEILGTIELLNHMDIPQVDAVAHSKGGVLAIIAALLYPDKFRNITLINPAGLVAQQSTLSLAWDFFQEMLAQGNDPETMKFVKSRVEASGPGNHSWDKWRQRVPTAQHLAQADIAQMLQHIRNQGVGIALINSQDDRVFSPEDIADNLDDQSLTMSDVADIQKNVPGNHSSIFQTDDAFIDYVLDPLENLKVFKQNNVLNT